MRDLKKEFIVIGVRKLNRQGGMEKHVREIATRMATRGWRVEVLESCADPTGLRGVVTSSIAPARSGGIEKVIYNVRAALVICKRKPRLAYVAGLNAGLLIWLFRLYGIKVVARLGSSDFAYPKFGFMEKLVLRWCLYNYKFANRVIVVNEAYLNYFESRRRRNKVRVIGNGIDAAPDGGNEDKQALRRYQLEQGKYVLTVGRVTPEKNYRRLIEAFLRLPDTGWSLAIAGASDREERSSAHSLDDVTNNRVRFLGEVPHHLIRELYASCACYVNASLFEGQSNAVLEALSCSAPILLSDIPGNRSVELPEKHYFSPLDVSSLTAKLADVSSSPSTYVASGFNGAAFDWERICDKVEDVLVEALNE